jgi:hypothetical protein
MTAKDYVPRVAAVVAVVFIMQGLVQVADKMNHEFEGLGAGDSGFGGRCRAELRSASGASSSFR